MIGHRAVICLAVLAALVVSAVSVAGASAAVTGTTAFTCVKSETGTQVGPHCLAGTPTVANAYTHVGFTTQTAGTATSANTKEETKASKASLLEVTLGGLKTEIECTEVHGESLMNNKTAGEEMYVHVTGSLLYTGCKLLKPQPTKCSSAAVISTEPLTGTSQGQGDGALIKPSSEKKEPNFALIKIFGAECPVKNEVGYPVMGSVKATISGATVESVAATVTAQETLSVGGQKAGLEGALTLKAQEKEGEETKPLTFTTPPYTETTPENGTTAFTCVKSETGTKVGPHCVAGTPTSGNAYKHVGFTSQTTGTATNANTKEETKASKAALLEATIAEFKTEIECTEVHGEVLINNRIADEEMYAHLTGGLTYKGCKLLKPQPTKCSTPATYSTKELTGTTQEQWDRTIVAPIIPEGRISTLVISGAECPIAGEYPVTGSIKTTISGATVESVAATVTSQETLSVGGQKAGLEGALTLKAHEKEGEETMPLTFTAPPYTE
jgi:hypothetical protein